MEFTKKVKEIYEEMDAKIDDFKELNVSLEEFTDMAKEDVQTYIDEGLDLNMFDKMQELKFKKEDKKEEPEVEAESFDDFETKKEPEMTKKEEMKAKIMAGELVNPRDFM